MSVLYLCDGEGCRSKNKSCKGKPETSEFCMHTTDPDHAVNGPCEYPEQYPDRFHEFRPGLFVEVSFHKFTSA